MSAVIVVLAPPFFTRPEADGSFRVDGLPAGRHTVVAWHERPLPDSADVDVPDGGAAQLDFVLGR